MNLAVDASVLLSILLKEPDGPSLLHKLKAATSIWISPVNWWEVLAIYGSRTGPAGYAVAAEWMESLGVAIEPVTLEQARIAVEAHARFGGRPAKLNMGDCFAYALARSRNVPLLYIGNDFAATDIAAA